MVARRDTFLTFPRPDGLFPKNEYAEAKARPSQDLTSGYPNRKKFGGSWHRRTITLFSQPAGQGCTEKQEEKTGESRLPLSWAAGWPSTLARAPWAIPLLS